MKSTKRSLGACATALALCLAACGSDGERKPLSQSNADLDAGSAAFTPPATSPNAAANVCQKMDILFVIDDSGSMSEEQAALAQSFPRFVSVLNEYQVQGGGLLDYRVAITSTGRDVKYLVKTKGDGMPELTIPFDQKGMNGNLRQQCGMTRRWIERTDPDAVGTFSCAAKIGTFGPGVEMPLLASELALVDRMKDGANAGFLRDDALLAIVYITDEEDCSRLDNDFTEINDYCTVNEPQVIPPSHFAETFNALKGGPGRWATAAIAGPGVCRSAFGNAYEAARLKQFVGLAGANGIFASICDGNMEKALELALDTFKAACNAFPPPK